MWPDDSGGTGGLALGAQEYLNNGSYYKSNQNIQPKSKPLTGRNGSFTLSPIKRERERIHRIMR